MKALLFAVAGAFLVNRVVESMVSDETKLASGKGPAIAFGSLIAGALVGYHLAGKV